MNYTHIFLYDFTVITLHFYTENCAEIENLSSSLKEEKQLRRKYEADLKVLQEECGELREEKHNLERVSVNKWILKRSLYIFL